MGKRGRAKSHKDFTIKLNHPEMGDFYYHYHNNGGYYSGHSGHRQTYYFTQNLNKVTTWKTSKYAETQIKEIFDTLQKNEGHILLEFGEEPNEELKGKLTISRKKYYFTVKSIMSKHLIKTAKDNVDKLNESLVNDSKMITKLIKKNKHIEKDFLSIINKLTTDAEPVFLDIVDASYGFRLLKLRTLKKIQIEDEVQS